MEHEADSIGHHVANRKDQSSKEPFCSRFSDIHEGSQSQREENESQEMEFSSPVGLQRSLAVELLLWPKFGHSQRLIDPNPSPRRLHSIVIPPPPWRGCDLT